MRPNYSIRLTPNTRGYTLYFIRWDKTMKSYRYFVQLFGPIILLLAGLAWVWMTRTVGYAQSQDLLAAPQEGFIAPEFTLSGLNATEFTLSEFRGRPIVINFWASWCPPCRAEMPAFQQAYHEFLSKDLIIIGINATNQDQLTAVEEFIKINKLTFPILLDRSGSVSSSYNLYSLPTTIFIDRSGTIQKIIIGGPIPTALLRVEIDNLFEE